MRRPALGDLEYPLAPIGRHSRPLARSRWLWVLADRAATFAVLHLLGAV